MSLFLLKMKFIFSGQPLALIIAIDESTARKAARLIEIEIEETEAVFDPRLAKQKGMLLIPPRTFKTGNISAAWSECEYIFDGSVESEDRSICISKRRELMLILPKMEV
ncbi:MAG: hypothetical protein MZV64_25780 [Ignavibacteriales bacterium]|nr:hypothetical protein [Ignavibacteriales bacterium]